MSILHAEMKEAAQTLSLILTRHNIEHAFIGGFALNMLGSDRETCDIDVEIAVDSPNEIRDRIVPMLCHADSHFVEAYYKLYFGASRIPIETLARGTLNLPRRLTVIRPGDGSLPILHPSVLILTKIKRASQYIGSTRPHSQFKYNADVRDIVHLLYWLRAYNQRIDFGGYDAAAPERLYEGVRKIRVQWESTGQSSNVEMLEEALEMIDKLILMN
ncbi:hypothetical protein ACHAQI_008298 [Fusarium lateritium]